MWLSAGGVPCSMHQACFSGYCASGKCTSDSPAPLAAGAFGHAQRNRGQVPGGGLCSEDLDCYSGYCESQTMCGPDGPKRGTLAAGAVCTSDKQCYSQYCFQRRCVAAAVSSVIQPQYQMIGKVAPGGRCSYTEACAPGSVCTDTYCKPTDPHGQSVMENLAATRPTLSSVHWNGTCWHNAQCVVGQCLEHRCTVAWFLAERYASSASMLTSQIGMLVVSVVVLLQHLFRN